MEHLEYKNSDHRPIFVDIEEGLATVNNTGKAFCSRFYFVELWTFQEDCNEIIKDGWQNIRGTSAVDRVQDCVRGCTAHLKRWSRDRFGNRIKKLKEMRWEIDMLLRKASTPEEYDRIRLIAKEMDDFLRDEEIYWKQRSRALWLSMEIEILNISILKHLKGEGEID